MSSSTKHSQALILIRTFSLYCDYVYYSQPTIYFSELWLLCLPTTPEPFVFPDLVIFNLLSFAELSTYLSCTSAVYILTVWKSPSVCSSLTGCPHCLMLTLSFWHLSLSLMILGLHFFFLCRCLLFFGDHIFSFLVFSLILVIHILW